MILNSNRMRWIAVVLGATLLGSCNSDENNKAKAFCSGVQAGHSINDVIAKSEAADLSKIWLVKIEQDGQPNERIGSINLRDITRQTEKFKAAGHPNTWARGKFNAMDQVFGFLRYICEIDFANAQVTSKKVFKVD
ncbi:MAG: hypothetical protein E2O41_02745 [Nitrospina sp.]|nr:MAG: hypothetical protein E2O41_02745 [Nitrospina sp.]